MKPLTIDWKRIKNDVNGNPRYVCHFLNLIPNGLTSVNVPYEDVVKYANTIGGRKFHNKQYGGGIVFQSYNLHELEKHIQDVKDEIREDYTN